MENKYNIPDIKLNGKYIDLKNMSCRKIVITKEVNECDSVKIELLGNVEEINPTTDIHFVEIIVLDHFNKKKIKFTATKVEEFKIFNLNDL
jgi:hypothetical protein